MIVTDATSSPVSKHLLSDFSDPTPSDIVGLCSFYKVDPTAVAREVSTFRPLYRQMYTLVSVADLVPTDVKKNMTHEEDSNHDDEEYPTDQCLNTWANQFHQTVASYYGTVWLSSSNVALQNTRDVGSH